MTYYGIFFFLQEKYFLMDQVSWEAFFISIITWLNAYTDWGCLFIYNFCTNEKQYNYGGQKINILNLENILVRKMHVFYNISIDINCSWLNKIN